MPFSFNPDKDPTSPQNGVSPSTSNPVSTQTVSSSANIDIYNRPENKSGFGLTTILTIIVVIFVIIAGGLYFYVLSLNKSIENSKAQIAVYNEKIKGFDFNSISNLANRLEAIDSLLVNHPFVSTSLDLVKDSVENNITYKSFTINSGSGDDKSYSLILEGESKDYKSLIQQIDTLKLEPIYIKYISNVEVKGLTPNKNGKVDFSLSMKVLTRGDMARLYNENKNMTNNIPEQVVSTTTSTSSETIISNDTVIKGGNMLIDNNKSTSSVNTSNVNTKLPN